MKIDALLDTSIIVDYFRQNSQARQWFQTIHNHHLAISPVVWMETVQGARNKIERAQIIRFLHQFRIEHATADDIRWAMLQIAHFNLSHGVELADVMIASVSVRLDVPLYTLNLKHYLPLPGVDAKRPY